MRIAAGLLAAGLLACSKTSTEAAPPASTAAPVASSSAAPPAVSAAPSASVGVSSAWHGTYKSAASTLSVPPDWSKVHWSDTKTTDGIGDGTITLAVDGATGRVTGALEGPLGPATIDGALADGKLSATLRRKDPTDHGFTGTLIGTVTGDHVDGTMNVSLGTASALRTATFALSAGAAH